MLTEIYDFYRNKTVFGIIKRFLQKLIEISNFFAYFSNIPRIKKGYIPSSFKEVLPSYNLEIRSIVNQTTSTPSKFLDIQNIFYDNIFITELNNGRVWGTQGTIMDSENFLFLAVSREYDLNGKNLSIFKQRRLIAPTYYNNNIAVIATSGAEVYYHWLLDIVPRIILLKSHCSTKIDFWVLNYSNLPFQNEILNLLDIPLDKLIVSDNHWNFHIEANKLIVPSLISPNNSPSKWAIDNVAALIKSDIKQYSQEKIYLRRGVGRHILNEQEVLAVLLPLGFKVINPEEYTVKEQSEIFSASNFIISAHGSALANIIFCEKGTKIIDIFADDWINPCYSIICAIKSLKYGYLIGKNKKTKGKINKAANILVEIEELKILIGKFESFIQ